MDRKAHLEPGAEEGESGMGELGGVKLLKGGGAGERGVIFLEGEGVGGLDDRGADVDAENS